MLSKTLLTSVDHLVEYVKDHNNCNMTDLKKEINVSTDLLEKWVTILEEYGVLKVKYKGLDAYVQFTEKETKEEKKSYDLELFRDLFIRKCKTKNMSYDKIKKVWPLFVSENEEEMKDMFAKKAKSEGMDMEKINVAWERYKKDLVRL